MRRFAATFAALTFFTMTVADSSACYLMMLRCEPVMNCSVRVEAALSSDCQTPCGMPVEMDNMICVPDDTRTVIVCIFSPTSDAAIRLPCNLRPEAPLISTLAERKSVESNPPAELPVAFGIKLNQDDQNSFIRDSRRQGIHPTIPTTVLRC